MHHGTVSASSNAAGEDKAASWLTARRNSREAARGAASMASRSVTNVADSDAVVFSIQFYGKTIGEVGLMDQDLSQLDWNKFKSYIFQNLLSMNHQENIRVSYSDDEGDKLPIESEEEYREALKVAKKKAEAHDKLVLDITRQGGLPTVFSIVSSGIKRVSSSPPKEGGISFFKSSSPPKESSGFLAKNSGPERKMFSSLFSSDRGEGDISGGEARPKEAGRNCEQPPEWFATYMSKFREELCEDVVTKLACVMREGFTISPKADIKEPHKFLKTETEEPKLNFKSSRLESNTVKACSQPSQLKNDPPSVWAESGCQKDDSSSLQLNMPLRHKRKSSNPQKRTSLQLDLSIGNGRGEEKLSDVESNSKKKEGVEKEVTKKADNEIKSNNSQKISSFQVTFTELKDSSRQKAPALESHSRKKDGDVKENVKNADSGTKRKKSVEDERFTKWLEKMEEKMARKQGKMEEVFSKKHEKLEERLIKKQEKLVERFQKQQEKAERRRSSKPLEMEKSSRTQGKVLAKMEGLRKKQSCTPEELSKLRKVVDKHHRVADKHHDRMVADQRQLRRSERKVGYLKAGKSRKIDIDSKALLELEALAEDSPNERHSSAILGYNAFYVRDITYPDGSRIPAGAQFVKTWRVLNSGLMAWNEKTELCKWTQVQFQGSPVNWKLKPLEKKVVCPPLKPGECGNISITFIAPDEPGWYVTHWRFCQQGRVFGNQIWCAVYVTNNTDSDPKSQANCIDNKTDSYSTQSITEDDCRSKKSQEPPTTEEQSSEEDVPNFVDAAKDLSKTENTATVVVADSAIDSIPDPRVEQVSCDKEACQPSEYEVGIIENYYDAEDPAEDTQHESEAGQDSTADSETTTKLNMNLISFEEEAELVPSRSISPEVVHMNSVVPLKDMAKESVASLRGLLKDSATVTDDDRSHDVPSESCGLDELSVSSGSFSDLDSEDQAILNESDTDVSDQDYFVVNMPECFDLTLPYSGVVEANLLNGSHAPTNGIPEAERHDSPDFLTADEDDRTTVAFSCRKNQDESVASNRSTLEDGGGSNHTGPIFEMLQSDCLEDEEESMQGLKAAGGNIPSLPLPPTETKGFMDIPPEALKTNLAISLYKEHPTRPEVDQQQQQQQQESGQTNWTSGTEEGQEVVCEQPVAAQMKAGASLESQAKLSPSACDVAGDELSQETATAATSTQQQLNSDRAAALPEELVSIIPEELANIIPEELVSVIPEDLVRGVWNTARTFITRINQEMLSPSANGPTRGSVSEGDAETASPPHLIQEPPQQEDRREVPSIATPEAGEEPSSLPPPLQQLADMGFSNHEVNQCLLTKYNNDVACAVAELIVLNCQ